MSTEKPNPNDYSFNYVITYPGSDEGSVQASSYPEAEKHIVAESPNGCCFDEDWRDGSDVVSMLACEQRTKVVWMDGSKRDEFESLEAEIWDEKFGDPIDFADGYIKKNAWCVIAKRRDAFEQASTDWHNERMIEFASNSIDGDNESDEGGDDFDVGEGCPFCGSTQIGSPAAGTLHCYACQSTFDDNED